MPSRTVDTVPSVCEQCVSDLLFCDMHDAYFCPVCDAWVEAACGDATCDYCKGRAVRPSECIHPERHYRTH